MNRTPPHQFPWDDRHARSPLVAQSTRWRRHRYAVHDPHGPRAKRIHLPRADAAARLKLEGHPQ